MTTIDAPRIAAGEGSGMSRRDEIMRGLPAEVPLRATAGQYKRALVLLTAAMIVSYLAFALLVVFLLWLVVWHVYSVFVSWQYGPYFLFHGPMAIVGGVIVFFILKPFFLKGTAAEGAEIVLTREREPLLFEFVEALCARLGSPAPARIEVDCTANASAGFHRGFLGLIGGKFVLRVGLPLVAGLTLEQFAGVLAHELGHFSQRTGMRGSFLIRWLNGLFTRIVFQRDKLDQRLARLRYANNGMGALIYWPAMAAIEPARGILWLMLVLGNLVTCHFMRRMEFDADLVTAALVGSRGFGETDLKVALLGIAQQRVHQQSAQSWSTLRLGDDFPWLVVLDSLALQEQYPAVVTDITGHKTRRFDTHPAYGERVANVEAAQCPGVFHVKLAAAALFSDFTALCKEGTRSLYAAILKKHAEKATLIPSEELAAEWHGQAARYTELNAYFRSFPGTLRVLLPDGKTPVHENLGELAKQLEEARQGMVAAAQGILPVVKQARELRVKCAVAANQEELTALFPANPRAMRLYRRARRQMKKGSAKLDVLRGKMAAFEEAATARISLAVQLAKFPEVAERSETSRAAAEEIGRLLPLAYVLQKMEKQFDWVGRRNLALRQFLGAYNPQMPYRMLVDKILATGKAIRDEVVSTRTLLDCHPYPFAHATAGIGAGSALYAGELPVQKDAADLTGAAGMFAERSGTLSMQVLSRLASAAKELEMSAGLVALPDAGPSEEEERERKIALKQRRRSTFTQWAAYSARAAAGLLLMGILIGLSLHPPTFSSWNTGENGAYRPAAFAFSVEHYNRYSPTAYVAPSAFPNTPTERRVFVSGAPVFIPSQPGAAPVSGFHVGPVIDVMKPVQPGGNVPPAGAPATPWQQYRINPTPSYGGGGGGGGGGGFRGGASGGGGGGHR